MSAAQKRPSLKQEFDELHENLGMRKDYFPSKSEVKRRFFGNVELMLRDNWKSALSALQEDSPDGLGLLADDSFGFGTFLHLTEQEREWLVPEALMDSLTRVKSQTEAMNLMSHSMKPSMDAVMKDTIDACRTTTPDLFGKAILSASERRGAKSDMPEFDLTKLVGQGFGTARQSTWGLFDVSHRLFLEKYGEAPTPEQWRILCQRTLPILGVLAKTHMNVLFHLNNTVRSLEGRRQSDSDLHTPPMQPKYFELEGTPDDPQIRYAQLAFDQTFESMLGSDANKFMSATVGCPGSHIIAPFHKWCLQVADKYLLQKSKALADLPRLAPTAEVIPVVTPTLVI